MCWLDLANVFGSVHRSLIYYILKQYHAPNTFLGVVSSLYAGLNETISSKSWSTRPIPLQLGVYQGDPLSAATFNTAMATLVDAPVEATSLGYTFAKSSTSINVLQYADNTCIIADGPAHCQHMLSVVKRWLEWSGMKANVSKCYSLLIAASTAKRYDLELKVPYIGSHMITFLGGPINVFQKNAIQKQHLVNQLKSLLQKVDCAPVSRKQKLFLYKVGVCPQLTPAWELGITTLLLSWVRSTLELEATHYIPEVVRLCKTCRPLNPLHVKD